MIWIMLIVIYILSVSICSLNTDMLFEGNKILKAISYVPVLNTIYALLLSLLIYAC